MLSKNERNELRRRRRLMELELYNQYDVVTSFYPEQQLTLTLKEEDVITIMDCDHKRARSYLKKVREKLGKDESWHVRTFEFCDYLNVEEMFIQLHLASLKPDGPLAPVRKRKSAPANPIDATNGKPRKIDDLKAYMQKGIMESFETVKNRIRLWEIENPLGEPMACPAFKNWRTVIRPFEAAQIIGVHIDTARAMFKEARKDKDLPKQRYLSIRMFCKSFDVDEEDVRKALAYMYDEKEDENKF
jgi:hypothetical protein